MVVRIRKINSCEAAEYRPYAQDCSALKLSDRDLHIVDLTKGIKGILPLFRTSKATLKLHCTSKTSRGMPCIGSMTKQFLYYHESRTVFGYQTLVLNGSLHKDEMLRQRLLPCPQPGRILTLETVRIWLRGISRTHLCCVREVVQGPANNYRCMENLIRVIFSIFRHGCFCAMKRVEH